MHEFDDALQKAASQYGLTYSRYADDLMFSTSADAFSRDKAKEFVEKIYAEVLNFGFEPNRTKTTILPPRSRKIILGLLVDREAPRLRKDFKRDLENHVHYISHPNHGPTLHAVRRGFTSVIGLQNYINGLLAYAAQIDPQFAFRMREKLKHADWPI